MQKPTPPIPPTKPRQYDLVENQLGFAYSTEVSLPKLISLIPKGIKKKDVKFKVVKVGEGDSAIWYLQACYSGKIPNKYYETHLKEYKKSMLIYEENLKKYNILQKKYEIFTLRQQVIFHKNKLKELNENLSKLR